MIPQGKEYEIGDLWQQNAGTLGRAGTHSEARLSKISSEG